MILPYRRSLRRIAANCRPAAKNGLRLPKFVPRSIIVSLTSRYCMNSFHKSPISEPRVCDSIPARVQKGIPGRRSSLFRRFAVGQARSSMRNLTFGHDFLPGGAETDEVLGQYAKYARWLALAFLSFRVTVRVFDHFFGTTMRPRAYTNGVASSTERRLNEAAGAADAFA